MSRQLKSMMTEAVKSRYADVDEACVVDISKLNVADTVAFRRALSSKEMRISVVKNSMARRAFDGGPLEPLGRSLSGPCALVVGGDSAIEVAKEIVRLLKEMPKVEPKIALLSGEAEVMPLEEVAKLKSQRELVGDIAGLLRSPGAALAGCISSPASKIAGCLKAMIDGASEEGDAAEGVAA